MKLKCRVEGETSWFEVVFRNIPFTARPVERITMSEVSGTVPSPTSVAPQVGVRQQAPFVAPQPRTLEETVNAEVTDLAGEAVRRAGQSVLNWFKKGRKKRAAEAEESEESPDGD